MIDRKSGWPSRVSTTFTPPHPQATSVSRHPFASRDSALQEDELARSRLRSDTMSARSSGAVESVVAEIHRCRICAEHLPHGVRPVLRVSGTAKLAIVSQAPGIRVHETGLSFNDASGDRLRAWLKMD